MTMRRNKKNILAVAAMMEAAPDRLFDMREHGAPECGVAGCIAGWAMAWAWSTKDGRDGIDAADTFGLNADEYEDLCVPNNEHASFIAIGGKRNKRYITRERAVKQLRYLARTGKVDWSKAR